MRRLFSGTPRESIAYLNHPVVYDTRRAVELLGARGLRPPTFSGYVATMVRFFAEHEGEERFLLA